MFQKNSEQAKVKISPAIESILRKKINFVSVIIFEKGNNIQSFPTRRRATAVPYTEDVPYFESPPLRRPPLRQSANPLPVDAVVTSRGLLSQLLELRFDVDTLLL